MRDDYRASTSVTLSLSTVPAQMPDLPGRLHHQTHHTGIVDGIAVDDTGVRIRLLLRVDKDLEVRFDHTFDPLLAERAAGLEKGDVVAVSGFAWADPDTGDIHRYDGRGLTTRPRIG